MGCKYRPTWCTFSIMQTTPVRLLCFIAFTFSWQTSNGQFFFGLGGEHRQYSAERLKPSSNMVIQLGYSWGSFSLVGQTKSSWNQQHWTSPEWLAGGRFEWRARDLTALSNLNNGQKLYLLASIQNSIFQNKQVVSEHLGWFTEDHWKREIYSFQYSRYELLYGFGVEFRNAQFAIQTEFQFGQAPTLDTWVYKSELYSNGNEIVFEDYYFQENHFTSRLSLGLRYLFSK